MRTELGHYFLSTTEMSVRSSPTTSISLWLFPASFRQQFLNHLLRVLVSFSSGVAELNHAFLIHNEMTGPRVAEIITPDLILVVDDNGILYPLLSYSLFDLGDVLLIVDARGMDADNNEPILRIFIIKLFDVGHRLSAKGTVPGPKINEDHLAPKLFQFERVRIDPGIAGLQFGCLLPNKNVIRMLRKSDTSQK